MTTISAVIATRDRGPQIRATLESILGGARLPDEILVLDQSRCDDRTAEMAVAAVADGDAFQDALQRCHVRYCRSTTRGLARARNEGMALAQGNVIAFTDDDVVVRRDWLERAAAEFDSYPDLALLFGSVEPPGGYDWRTEKVPYALVATRRPVRLLDRGSLGVMGANMLLRRSGFETIGPFDEILGAGTPFAGFEDTEYLLRALSHRPPLRVHTLDEARVVHHAGARCGDEYRRFVHGMYGTGMGRFWAHLLRQRRPAYLLCFLMDEADFLAGLVRSLGHGHRPRGVATHLYRWRALVRELVTPAGFAPSTSALSGPPSRRDADPAPGIGARDGLMPPMPRYRFAFVLDQQVGLRTEALRLERVLKDDESIAPTIVPVHYGPVRRRPSRSIWSGGLGTLHAIHEIRRGLGEIRRFDAVLWETWAAKAVPDLVDAAPCFLRMDMTPVQMAQMGGPYGYGRARAHFLGALKRYATDHLYRRAVHLFPWSHYAANSLVADYGVPADKITVISPGTDVRRFRPPELSRASGDGVVRILFVGGDFQRKGGDTLVRWAKQRRDTEPRVEICMVTREAGLPDDLASLGIVLYRGIENDSDALVRLYQQCDVFALPTRADCYSLAALEAMACGLPVVISDIGGISDIVWDGETGFLVPPGDETAFGACLSTLVSSPALRTSFGAAARRRAELEFDSRRCLGRLLSAMKETVT